MIEEYEEDDQLLKYVPQMNFSYFTEKYEQMEENNDPNDNHHQIQKKWIQVIRNAVRTTNIQTVVVFLYASKAYTTHCKNVLTKHFDIWKDRYQNRYEIRNNWIKLSKYIILQNQNDFFNEIRNQMHEIRTNRTIRYLTSLSQYQNPDYNLFLKQINDNQYDDSAVRIGFRKREKYGLCTTETQTPREENSEFEFEKSDSSI